jgi:hypothetical protein
MAVQFLVPPLIAVGAMGAWAGVLWYLGAWTPPEVRAWNRIAVMRGYAVPYNPVTQIALKLPALNRFFEDTDIRRLLVIAGKKEMAAPAFWTKAAGQSLLMAVVLFATNLASLALLGDWMLPAWLPFVIGGMVFVSSFTRLRKEAQNSREECNRAMGDMLMMVTALSGERGIPPADAVRLLSGCVEKPNLSRIVENQGWKKLINTQPRSTSELYEAIADVYGIELMGRMAEALKNADVGMRNEDVLTRLATATYEGRLLEARQWSARAKILIIIPVSLMLIPLLAMIGAPVFSAISGSL